MESPPPASELELGPFTLVSEAGTGATGTVWAAHFGTTTPGRLPAVAVKILDAELATEERWTAAFLREVQAVAGLDHPSIVKVFEHGRVTRQEAKHSDGRLSAGSPYLAMEYYPSGTLTRRAGLLPWAELKAVLLALLDGLAHAHARGVIHRDLKPGNVLVGENGCVLSDFGLGYSLLSDDPDAHRVVGTPAYMAPEQFEGRWRDYGPWTDLYALGCLAYAMSASRPPFGARKTASESMLGHLYESPPPLESVQPVPAGYEDWIGRLMAKSPTRRFRWAADAAWVLSRLELSPQQQAEARATPRFNVDLQALPSLSLPSRTPTDLSHGELPDLDSLLQDEDEAAAPVFAPPCRPNWRQPEGSSPVQDFKGLGLGLYGLRSIPLIGRDEERTELWEALRDVHSTRRLRVCLLSGIGGTGKSRLAQWLCERAHETGAAGTLRTVHSPSSGPGEGLAAMVTRHLGCTGLDRSKTLERIRRTWAQRLGLSDEEGQALTEFVHPGVEDEESTEAKVCFQSPLERNTALERLLRRESMSRPTVLWLDDVQWGLDSLFFVLHLLSLPPEQAELPLLVVLTYREDLLVEREAEAELLQALVEFENAQSLAVGPLIGSERLALVRELLGLEGEVADQVDERTAGNPLFAVQLVGDWVQRGLLIPSQGGFALREGASLDLPDDLHSFWLERIERLLEGRHPEDGQRLELAAMLGQRVDWGEWHSACEHSDSSPSRSLVDELVRRRLAERQPGRAGGDDWAFVHGMLRESLERRAREDGRAQELHRTCAATLAEHGGPEGAARRAHHLLAAEDRREAVAELARAASGFIDRGEPRRAEGLLDDRDEALEFLDLPEGAEELVRGLLLRSYCAQRTRNLSLAIELARKTEQRARDAGLDGLLAEALRARGTTQRNQGRFSESIVTLAQAIAISQETGDLQCLADCLRGRGLALTHLGQLGEAAESLSQALALHRQLDDRYGIASGLLSLTRLATAQDEFLEVRSLAEEGLSRARSLGNRSLTAGFLNQLGEAARGLGELPLADDWYAQAIGVAQDLRDPWVGILESNRGLVLVELEAWEEACSIFRGAQASLQRSQAPVASALVSTFLLPCLAALELWDEWAVELAAAREGLRQSGKTEPDLARMPYRAALLALKVDRKSEAAAALRLARDQWTALGKQEETERVQRLLDDLQS